jgi:hypothetical protein
VKTTLVFAVAILLAAALPARAQYPYDFQQQIEQQRLDAESSRWELEKQQEQLRRDLEEQRYQMQRQREEMEDLRSLEAIDELQNARRR